MKFGIAYNTAYKGVDPDRIVLVATRAEASGFESFYVTEHVAAYPGAMLGSIEIDPSLPFADPLEVLTFVAAETDRILLGTGVLLIPYHQPVLLAKRLATIDVLSKGRMRLLTAGLGMMPREAEAVGVEYGSRGRRADEAIDVLRLLWSGDERGVSFDGEFFSFPPITSFPKPYMSDALPIHIGGSSRAAARRAGLRGDGYFPGGRLAPAERTAQVELMRTTALQAGRDPAMLEYTRWASNDLSHDDVGRLERQGVSRLVIGAPALDLQEQLDEITAFAQRVGLT